MTEILNNHFVIEVPKEARDYFITDLHSNGTYLYYITVAVSELTVYNIDDVARTIKLSDKKDAFVLLGCVTESEIDFDVSGLVEKPKPKEWDSYKDYTDDTKFLYNPEKSFRSLLKSKGIEIKQGTKLLVVKKTLKNF